MSGDVNWTFLFLLSRAQLLKSENKLFKFVILFYFILNIISVV
jgi:hypothetical protein